MNYYEELELSCEGKDADNIKLIQDAIDRWERKTTNARNNETAEAKRRVLDAKLAELPRMRLLLTDAALRKKHAEELKKDRMEQLDSIVQIIATCSSSGKSIASARVDRIARTINLSTGTVKKRFAELKFEVVQSKPVEVSSFILSDVIMRNLDDNFRMVRSFLQENPHEPLQELQKAGNLYQYIAVQEGKSIADAVEYETKNVKELNGIFEKKISEHIRNAKPITYYKNIESMAKVQIFTNEQNREKYDNALKLKAWDDFFEVLRAVPTALKLEPEFAQRCIEKLQKGEKGHGRETPSFPDEDQAIALYNRYSGLPLGSQYEKEDPKIAIVCASCGAINLFDTVEEAHSATCRCKESLFRKCPNPKCGKIVPASADFCSCGFFIKGTQTFELHYQRFMIALKELNLDKCREALVLARTSNPSDRRIPEMETALKKVEEEIGKPIQKIKELLAAKLIKKAREEIIRLQAERPNIDLSQYLTTVQTETKWAENEYTRCKTAAEGQALEGCIRILERVADFTPAQEWLRQHPPKSVKNLECITDAKEVSCTIQWKDHPDNRFVTFTVVRKENAWPTNVKDGIVLKEGLHSGPYQDKSLRPGILYGYAVFAVRGDSYSMPARPKNGVMILQPLDSVQIFIENSTATLTWKDIPGSKGIRIQRSDNGAPARVVSNESRGMFIDKTVKENATYRYMLETIWEWKGNRYFGDAVSRDIKVAKRPARVDLVLDYAKVIGDCKVNWTGRGTYYIKLLRLNPGVSIVPDQVYSDQQMTAMGEFISNPIPVGNGTFSWFGKQNDRFRLAAFSIFGDSGVAGSSIEVSTIPPLAIDEENTKIVSNSIQLVLQPLPDGVRSIYYSINGQGMVITEDMVRRKTAPSITANDYKAKRMIVQDSLPKCELTVSLIAVYETNGKTALSPTALFSISNAPKQNVEYRFEWGSAGFFGGRKSRDGGKVVIRSHGNRIPEASVCCRQDGKMIFNYIPGMAGVVELAHIPSQKAEPRLEIAFPLDESRMKGIPSGTVIKMFLAGKETNAFEIPQITDTNSWTLP